MTGVKICGIRDEPALRAIERAGADFVGFVFVPQSTRGLAPEAAGALARTTSLTTVGLFTDPDDDTLRGVLARVPLRMIQLHGAETPARVAAVRAMTGLPVMKAVPVADKSDLAPVPSYEDVADWLLFDTKVGGTYGGTGRAFDWTLLEGYVHKKPWMLAGGLNAGNVGMALSKLSPDAVDVSSGVESAPGVKDACKIAAFVESVRSCRTA